jgi:hypothetical protein
MVWRLDEEAQTGFRKTPAGMEEIEEERVLVFMMDWRAVERRREVLERPALEFGILDF